MNFSNTVRIRSRDDIGRTGGKYRSGGIPQNYFLNAPGFQFRMVGIRCDPYAIDLGIAIRLLDPLVFETNRRLSAFGISGCRGRLTYCGSIDGGART